MGLSQRLSTTSRTTKRPTLNHDPGTYQSPIVSAAVGLSIESSVYFHFMRAFHTPNEPRKSHLIYSHLLHGSFLTCALSCNCILGGLQSSFKLIHQLPTWVSFEGASSFAYNPNNLHTINQGQFAAWVSPFGPRSQKGR